MYERCITCLRFLRDRTNFFSKKLESIEKSSFENSKVEPICFRCADNRRTSTIVISNVDIFLLEMLAIFKCTCLYSAFRSTTFHPPILLQCVVGITDDCARHFRGGPPLPQTLQKLRPPDLLAPHTDFQPLGRSTA